MAETTEASPVFVVDQYTGVDGAADTYDLIHPDASGDQKVATNWFASLEADAAPMAAPDAYTMAGGALDVRADTGLLANDRSLVGALRAELIDAPTHGRLTLSSDGAFVYEGDGEADQFTYVASDGKLVSTPTVVELAGG